MNFRYTSGVRAIFVLLAVLSTSLRVSRLACVAFVLIAVISGTSFAADSRSRELFSQGFSAFKARDFPRAAEFFRAGLTLDPSDYKAHLLLAQIYIQLNDDRATDSFMEVVKLAPSMSVESVEAKYELERLKPSAPLKRFLPRAGDYWVVRTIGINGGSNYLTRRQVVRELDGGSFQVRVTSDPESFISRAETYDSNWDLIEVSTQSAVNGRVIDSKSSKIKGESTIQYPLEIGEGWTFSGKMEYCFDRNCSIIVYSGRARVLGFDWVVLAGGLRERAYRIRLDLDGTSADSQTVWHVPKFGMDGIRIENAVGLSDLIEFSFSGLR